MSEKANKINVYTCEQCGHEHVTVNAVDGVTPFMIRCRDTIACQKGECYSAMYRCDQNRRPSWEWYRPDEAELEDATWDVIEHVRRGGLMIRRIDAAQAEKYGFNSRRG